MSTTAQRITRLRRNAKRGGVRTAQSHSDNWLCERAEKGGLATLLTYGHAYYRAIAAERWRRYYSKEQQE